MKRLGVLLAIASLLATACTGGTPSSQPSSAAATASDAARQAPPSTGPATVPPGGPVEIHWFCCLGTGEDKTQQPVEKKVVDDFNKTHANIKLVLEITPYTGANAKFATEIASGNGPDVVGPVGVGGAEAFHGQWLDLGPLIAKNNYDLTQYGQGAVDFYKIGDEGQVAIPFAVYPSELYYQPDMFDEAGLDYPPHKYGGKYKMPDGTEVDWNYDTVRKIAMLLTVDRNGKNATDPAFDATHIRQYGFEPQRDDLRGMVAYFGAGKLAGGTDGKTVTIPDAWKAGAKWIYDGIWKDHFIMTDATFNSTQYKDGAFDSGKVAMNENFLWNTCCVTNSSKDWDLAAIPSYNGNTTAVFNADTFRIYKNTKHPDEAFTVLSYLLGDASKVLLNAYTGFPARTADQADFFTQLEQAKDGKGKLIFPPDVDWQVAVDGIKYADNPNFEAFMPAYNESLKLLQTYLTRWTSTKGLDIDQQLTTLLTELQKIWDKKK
jgi:multiple sugar transport system substrate-binding protein